MMINDDKPMNHFLGSFTDNITLKLFGYFNKIGSSNPQKPVGLRIPGLYIAPCPPNLGCKTFVLTKSLVNRGQRNAP
jgi:hypothetical protein